MQELEIEAPYTTKTIAATMYSLGTWFVSEICVWAPCIKEIIIIIIQKVLM